MRNFHVYLAFSGNCEEALNFYKNCFDGEITSLQRFSDTSTPVPDEHKNKVMHSEFKADGIYFMASDGMPEETQATNGSNISLSINLTDENEQTAIFEKLSADGIVTMPLQDTFWNARFGMLTDKYGFHWMLNCEKNVG